MRPMRLDPKTADRLLDGQVGPDDAPPGYAGVTDLLGQARRGLRVGSAREAATVAAMSAAVLGHLDAPTTVRGKKMLSKVLTVKAGVVAGVVLFGAGSAAAATGSLPTQAQSAVHNALSHLDISVPDGSNPSKVLSNSHALPGICNAASHNGTLSTSSTHKPDKHSVFGSVTSSTCQGVPAPGESGTIDSSDSNDSNDSTESGGAGHSTGKPSSTPDDHSSGTPGSSHASVSTPDDGTSGSSASSGAGSAGLGTASNADGGASSHS